MFIMKKRVVIIFLVVLVLNLSIIFAQSDNDTSQRGYECLESKVKGKCPSFSLEEKIFSFLAIKECKNEILADSQNDECWPKGGCRIKTTSQAMLGLKEINHDVNKIATWLFAQKAIPQNLEWLLQIETTNPTSCKITYSGNSYLVNIGADKKIDRNAGNCLRVYGAGYWLEVSRTCYEVEFEISCSESFYTSLLYKDQTSSTVYVSQKINSASGEGTTREKVNSFCFGQGNTCDYEGSLWAALALKIAGYDVSAYTPYLVAMSYANQKVFPEVFLFYLLGDSYRNSILLKQKENQWWYETGDKFYDTALALYPFQNEQFTEKTNSVDWLSEVQGIDGCWQGNVRNTAFILYSIWPRKFVVSGTTPTPDCKERGFFCTTKTNCADAGGEELDYGGCFGLSICCSKEKVLETCSAQAGAVCTSEETCIGGVTVEASDVSFPRICCVGGECMKKEEKFPECELYGGYCRSTCYGNEERRDYECFSGVCCFETKAKKSNYLGIIIFSVLIFLVLIGFVFRKKLRDLWLRLKMKRGKGRGGPGRPGFRPGFPPPPYSPPSRTIPQRGVQRKIIPSSHPSQIRRLVQTKSKGEIDEVLKKLKEMGN